MIAGYSGPPICVGALCLALLQPAQAFAKPPTFSVNLEYEPAPGCPAAESVKAAVIARLGYEPFADDAPHHVALRIVPSATSLDGRIEWHDADGQWAGDQSFQMASGDCLRLTRTMALALAVQIQLLQDLPPDRAVDREASGAKPPAKTAPEAPSVKPPEESTATKTPSGAAQVTRTVPRAANPAARAVFTMGAGPAIGLGMAPYPIVLGRVFGLVAWQSASIQLAAEASLPSTIRRSDGAGVSEQMLLLSVAGCGARGRWSACLVVDAGRVTLAGRDIDLPTSTHLPYVDAGLRGGFTQPLGQRSYLNAHADGLVVLTRWTATLDDVPVWTTPRFAAAIGIDVGVQFR